METASRPQLALVANVSFKISVKNTYLDERNLRDWPNVGRVLVSIQKSKTFETCRKIFHYRQLQIPFLPI